MSAPPPDDPGPAEGSTTMDLPSDVATGADLTGRFLALCERAPGRPDTAAFLASHPRATARERVDVLLADQVLRWRSGDPMPVERYLAEHPDLASNPALKLDLVYGELRARRRRGEDPDLRDYVARFPDIGESLRGQAEVACWIGPSESVPPATPRTPSADHGGMVAEAASALLDPDAPLSSEDFELIEELGSGAMGRVYRAVQKSLRKPIAVKVWKRTVGATPRDIERFLAEGRAVARLNHSGIVGVHGVGRLPGGDYFLVMDLVEGPDLRDCLARGPFPVARAASIVAEVADAIDHAHRRGIVHRDLKPSNVLLGPDGRPVVTDFGVAKRLGVEASSLTAANEILGTAEYMAPEQADARRGPVGPRADVYGLGALLYALLAGRPPFRGRGWFETLALVASPEPPTPLRTLRPDVPEALEAICLKCLNKEADLRYGSAGEVARALQAWATAPDRPAPSPVVPATARLVRSPARAVGLVALLAAAILIAVLSPRVRPRPSRWADRPPSSIDPPGAPGTSPEPGAAQIAWGLLRGRGDRVTVLTESPGALVNGDSVQITCELSRPSYPHLFWVESEGTVRRLYPEADERATRIGTITWPRDATQGGAVIGSPGTELAVLLVSDSPLMDAELSRLEASLTLHPPLPPLDEGTILIDGQPVGVRGRRNDRGLGGRKALVGGAVAERLAQLRRAIPAEGVTISMLAVPHVASGPSRDDR